jgi:recombination protein RecA
MLFAAYLRTLIEANLVSRIPSALTPALKPEPQLISSGVRQLDHICAGGLTRGGLTEICGPKCSGRTSVLLSVLTQGTYEGHCCALIDVTDNFDPIAAQKAGVVLQKLLWVRCSKTRTMYQQIEQALKAADLLIQAGGFGMIALDFGDVDAKIVRRIPLTSWFRFRRGVENTTTALLVLEEEPSARTCASLVLKLRQEKPIWAQTGSADLSHNKLLNGLEVHGEVARSRAAKKPPSSVRFETTTAQAL